MRPITITASKISTTGGQPPVEECRGGVQSRDPVGSPGQQTIERGDNRQASQKLEACPRRMIDHTDTSQPAQTEAKACARPQRPDHPPCKQPADRHGSQRGWPEHRCRRRPPGFLEKARQDASTHSAGPKLRGPCRSADKGQRAERLIRRQRHPRVRRSDIQVPLCRGGPGLPPSRPCGVRPGLRGEREWRGCRGAVGSAHPVFAAGAASVSSRDMGRLLAGPRATGAPSRFRWARQCWPGCAGSATV